ncbi:MAG: P-loop NTPase [Oscillospiraceae bacterium]
MELTNFKRISIITGHYGSGKTNVAVNLALQLKEQHEKVTIVDLDIVNPYFRTSDFTQMLSEKGIKVIAPVYANTNLDIPALPPSINSIFDNKDSFVIVDVGGDDAGAIALGQFSNRIKNSEYDMYYVINECRFQTKVASEAVLLLSDIEYCSKVKATKIINNTNLGEETTKEIIENSAEFAQDISKQLNLPVSFTAVNKKIANEVKIDTDILPVSIYVKPFYVEKMED